MSEIESRKADHIRIALDEPVEVPGRAGSGWDGVRLIHEALPELHRDDVDPSVELLGKVLSFPLIIGSMTGGTPEAGEINRRLARAAARCGVGMGLGSQRVMIQHPETAASFQIREVAPEILLLGNIGAVQLNYGVGAEEVRSLASLVGADGMIFHLNAAQEAVQPEGDTRFGGLTAKLAACIDALDLPCGIKEVGSGFSTRSARRLASLPLAFVESAGQGGTSWTLIEGLRAPETVSRSMGQIFADWGIPSVTSLLCCLRHAGGVPVIASGGLRSGLDMARALALGATSTAMALPLIRAAHRSEDAVVDLLQELRTTLVTAMFLCGARDLAALRSVPHRVTPSLQPEVYEGAA